MQPPAGARAHIRQSQSQNMNGAKSTEHGTDLTVVKLRRSRGRIICASSPLSLARCAVGNPARLTISAISRVRSVAGFQMSSPCLLCRLHHRELHRQDDERAWWSKFNLISILCPMHSGFGSTPEGSMICSNQQPNGLCDVPVEQSSAELPNTQRRRAGVIGRPPFEQLRRLERYERRALSRRQKATKASGSPIWIFPID